MKINAVSNGTTITKENIIKNGIGSSTKNLKASANNKAVNTIFNLTPLKKDSTTNLDDLAPAYLNAFKAKTILGIIDTAPATKVDFACCNPQKKQAINEQNKTIKIANVFCLRASFRPALVNLLFIFIT